MRGLTRRHASPAIGLSLMVLNYTEGLIEHLQV